MTVGPVRRVLYRVHRLQPLLLSLGVDDLDDEVYHVDREREAQHGEEELDAGVSDLHALVVDMTSLDIAGPERMAGVETLCEGGVVVRLAARSVDQPPAEAPGSETEEILLGGEITDREIVTDDEHVEAQPEEGPQDVGDQVTEPQLVETEQSEDDEDNVEEVCQYRPPHVAHEVEYLSLGRGDQLDEENDVENVPGHAVLCHLDFVSQCNGFSGNISLSG